MDSKRESRPVHRSLLRGELLFLASTPLVGGLWALLFPRAFYDHFPLPGSDWVSTLGPYNEHLVRDYGALNLALSAFLVFAAVLLKRRFVQASVVAWLAYAVPHFIFHLGQTHHFSPGSNLAQLGGPAFLVQLPLVLLYILPQKGAGRDLLGH